VVRFYPLEKLINLEDGYTRQFKIDNLQLLLLQRAGERYCLQAHCPHRAHPLATASVESGIIQCPLHQYRFSLDSGAVVHASEEACHGLQLYELVYEGNEIGVMLEDLED